MTQPTSTIVYATAGIVKLTQHDRRKLVSTLETQELKYGQPVPHWVGQARSELQVNNSCPMSVGWVAMMVVNEVDSIHSDCCYAVTSYPLSEERIMLISLRSALLDTFMHEDVIVHVPRNKVACTFGNDGTDRSPNVSSVDEWEVVGSDADIINECKCIIQMRRSLGRKTAVTSDVLMGYSKKLKEMVDHVNKIEHGIADRVVFDSTATSTAPCAERVFNAADQLRVVLGVDESVVLDVDESKVQLKSVTTCTPKVNVINKIIGSAIAKHRSSTSRDGKSSLSIICSSCMRLVRITHHACVAGPSISALTTTHCKGCAVKGSSVVALTPILVQNLIGYNLLQQDENTKIAILKDGEYVKHVDAEAVFRALTTDHSIGSMSYEDKRIVELRGGFF